jgi:hypothetical protein
MTKITDLYPLDYLQWIEIPDDDKNAEVIYKMFKDEISHEDAKGFWEMRKRAFKELGHYNYEDMIRASASFAKGDEDTVVPEALRRKVDIEKSRLAYRELQERYKKIIVWRLEELEEKARQEEIRQKELKERQIQKQKEKNEQLLKEINSIGQSYRPVPKDKSEIARANYDRKIREKEEEYDNINWFKDQEDNKDNHFIDRTRHRSNQLEELFSHQKATDKRQISSKINKMQELQAHIQHTIQQQNEAKEEVYRKLKRNIDNEIEDLATERNKLPWD